MLRPFGNQGKRGRPFQHDRTRPNRSAQKKVLAMRPSTYVSQALTTDIRAVPMSHERGVRARPPIVLKGEHAHRSSRPPSDVRRPPSKAAVICLRETAGNENGRRLLSVMASVVGANGVRGWYSQPNPTQHQRITPRSSDKMHLSRIRWASAALFKLARYRAPRAIDKQNE